VFWRNGRAALALTAVGLLLASGTPGTAFGGTAAHATPAVSPVPGDWPTIGGGPTHTFANSTLLTESTVRTLAPRWFFQTGDAVTAEPIVVRNTVYFGSWDGYFYALNASTGALRWRYQLKSQPAIQPQPGHRTEFDAITSDGGMVTSTAWYQPGDPRSHRPDLVIFGGGFTLYALVADGPKAGTKYWARDFPAAKSAAAANPAVDQVRIFTSPLVVGNEVLFGVDSDGQDGYAGAMDAVSLSTGALRWRYYTDVAKPGGPPLYDGCNGVWSSPTLDSRDGLVFFGISDCHDGAPPPFASRVLALRYATGRLAWVFTPDWLRSPKTKNIHCDFDFGATPNYAAGSPGFLGIGGKDGTYYALDPRTGAERWHTTLNFGGSSGGFLASEAYDGHDVYGSTGIGDFSPGSPTCEPNNPNDRYIEDPSSGSFDGTTGVLRWTGNGVQSFASTTVAGGMVFQPTYLSQQLQVRDARSGLLLLDLPLPAASLSGAIPVGNALFLGTGSPQQGSPDGVYALTPLGESLRLPGVTSADGT
jgi:polyvinyl alcohol dehydrogenase (cytochrome)